MDDDRWNVGTFAEPGSCVQLKLKKGEAIIFNGRLVHCGGPGRETEAVDGFYTTMSKQLVVFSDLAWSRPFSNGTSVATDDDAFVESACVVGTGTPSDSVAEPGRGRGPRADVPGRAAAAVRARRRRGADRGAGREFM